MRNDGSRADRGVLLVEDNPDDVALTLRALSKAGVLNQVSIAADGAAAIDALFGKAAEQLDPGLILLDLNLPKLNGIEVLRRIREEERTRYVPVVILTSSAEQEDIVAGYHFGANAYVRKPVRFSEFAEAVSTLGMFWLMLNQLVPTAQVG